LFLELFTGDLSGKTPTSGFYRWGTGVSIHSDVVQRGAPGDVFIFQIAKGLTQADHTPFQLKGRAIIDHWTPPGSGCGHLGPADGCGQVM